MTAQEAYERIRAWFISPRHTFGYDTEENACVYRGAFKAESLKRCAVGCLMSVQDYISLGENPEYMTIEEIEVKLGWHQGDRKLHGFLEKAQIIHDALASETSNGQMTKELRADFISRLDKLAKRFSLEVVT